MAESIRPIGYIRVSSEEQADTGVSLQDQTRRIHAYAIAKGWGQPRIIRDEGKSAKDLKRSGLTGLRTQLGAGTFNAVIVAKLDRLTRRVRDLWTLLDEFHRHGVSLVSVEETVDATTAGGRMILNMLGSVAQWESEVDSERTRRGLQEVRRQGYHVGGQPPRGYRLVPSGERTRIVVDAKQQGYVLKVFETYAAGYGLWGTSKRMGGGISAWSVRRMLRNGLYAGQVNGHYDKGLRLVPEDLYRQVQTLLKARHRGGPHGQPPKYALTSLGRCAGCGRAMVITVGPKGQRFYECQGYAYRGRSVCPGSRRSVPLARVEEAVIKAVIKALSSPTTQRLVMGESVRRGSLKPNTRIPRHVWTTFCKRLAPLWAKRLQGNPNLLRTLVLGLNGERVQFTPTEDGLRFEGTLRGDVLLQANNMRHGTVVRQ